MESRKLSLEKALLNIHQDLKLYAKAIDSGNKLNHFQSINNITTQLEVILPDLQSWLTATYASLHNVWSSFNSISTHNGLFQSHLPWSKEWAVLSRGNHSFTFLQINLTTLAIQNSVQLEFDSPLDPNAPWVSFSCTPALLGVRLKFTARAEFLIDQVNSLLRSFQSPMVIAHRIQYESWCKEEPSRYLYDDLTTDALIAEALIDTPPISVKEEVENDEWQEGEVKEAEAAEKEVELEGEKTKLEALALEQLPTEEAEMEELEMVEEELTVLEEEEITVVDGSGELVGATIDNAPELSERVQDSSEMKGPVIQCRVVSRGPYVGRPRGRPRLSAKDRRYRSKGKRMAKKAKKTVSSCDNANRPCAKAYTETAIAAESEAKVDGLESLGDDDPPLASKEPLTLEFGHEAERDQDTDSGASKTRNLTTRKNKGITYKEDTDSEEGMESDSSEDEYLRDCKNFKDLAAFPCRLCSKLVTVQYAQVHMLRRHNISKQECSFCPQTFENGKHRRDHMKMYHPRREPGRVNCLECKVCQLSISRLESYRHMTLEHKRPKGECCFCDYQMDAEFISDDVNNIDVNEAMNRGLCKLSPVDRFKRHVGHAHKFKSDPLQCGRCQVSFANDDLLKEHRILDLEPSARSVPLCANKAKKVDFIPCSVCGVQINEKSLKRHMAFKHDIEKESVLKHRCTFCNKTVTTSSHLRKHLLLHHLRTQKQSGSDCSFCGRECITRGSLARHMRVHLEASIPCPHPGCGKLFKRKSNLAQHLRGCHYPREFECLVCHRRFQHRGVIRAHLKGHHKLVDIEQSYARQRIDVIADIKSVEAVLDHPMTEVATKEEIESLMSLTGVQPESQVPNHD